MQGPKGQLIRIKTRVRAYVCMLSIWIKFAYYIMFLADLIQMRHGKGSHKGTYKQMVLLLLCEEVTSQR